jgi:SAM-dependent methyltransferase
MLVAGTTDISWFLKAGRRGAESISRILERNGVRIGDLEAILDFGCGCGRVIRYFKSLGTPKLCGSDYNPKLTDWCRQNLTFAHFETNDLQPPLRFANGAFDLIYALSVFTHLPEALQFQWMEELSRVLRPGGHLLISTHGKAYWEGLLPEEQEKFRSGQLVTRNGGEQGSNFFGTYHPRAYVTGKLARAFDVVDHIPEGAAGNPRQDAFLLRKP